MKHDMLGKMTYLNKCLQETLRMYPPAVRYYEIFCNRCRLFILFYLNNSWSLSISADIEISAPEVKKSGVCHHKICISIFIIQFAPVYQIMIIITINRLDRLYITYA